MSERASNALLSSEPDVILREGDTNPYSYQQRPLLQIQGKPRIEFTNSPIRKFEKKAVFIADLRDPRLALKAPLPIHLEHAGSEMLGYSYDLDELEVADDEWSVIQKMRVTIGNLYFMLKDEQDNLGPLMQQHWNFLRKIISET
jgi:hypothetical protein